MQRTSRQFCAAALKKTGLMIFGPANIPAERPKLIGDYDLIVLVSGRTWQYGQLIHSEYFYVTFLASMRRSDVTIDGLISIHPTALATIPTGDYLQTLE